MQINAKYLKNQTICSKYQKYGPKNIQNHSEEDVRIYYFATGESTNNPRPDDTQAYSAEMSSVLLHQKANARPLLRAAGRLSPTGEGLFDQLEGGIRVAGPPVETNGTALLFGLLRTGVLRNVEIAAAERAQAGRSPFEIPAVNAVGRFPAGTSESTSPSVGVSNPCKSSLRVGLPPSITKSE